MLDLSVGYSAKFYASQLLEFSSGKHFLNIPGIKNQLLCKLFSTIIKEVKIMKNESIKCSVNNCTHHAETENYCTLNAIKVGTHESNPTKIECTDCESFVNKSK